MFAVDAGEIWIDDEGMGGMLTRWDGGNMEKGGRMEDDGKVVANRQDWVVEWGMDKIR